MLIIWGTKRVEKTLGWVAEYCPVCDEACACRLVALKMVSHIYYIPLGRGKNAGHVCRCGNCKNVFPVDEMKYADISRKRPASIEELVDQTHPELVEKMAKTLDMRDRVASGEGSEAERQALLFHPFDSIAVPVAKRGEHLNVDTTSALWLIGTIVLPLVALMICDSLPASWMHPDTGITVAVSVLVLTAICLGVSIALDTKRYARKQFRRMIVQRLAPLNPSLTELEQTLKTLKQNAGTRIIGKAFKPSKLYEQITRAREDQTVMDEG